MSDEDRSTGTDGLLAGRLEGISVPDLLWALSRRRRTGTLTVSGGGTSTTVYLDEGRVIFASTTDPDSRLGELLLREGDIRLDDLEEALAKLGAGKRLGTLLVEAGRLTAGRLVDAVLGQIHGIVLDLFDRDEGDYRFEEGALPTEEVITLGTRTEELLLQGIRRVRSFSRIRRSVGPLRTVYGLTDTWREALAGLGVTEGERRIAVVLERGDATVDTLCSEVYLSNFEVHQALWAFKVIGVVAERGTAIEERGDAVREGRLSQRDFADVLVDLHRRAATGVLHVARGQRERTFHLDAGRLVFATSNDIDDGLVAFLLRRGIISLRHRQEIARRLLSNRRVGTILNELGVIGTDELATMVRQHLAEIVHDTFAWADGEWAFVAGDLPTVEEIALESTVEALVAGGLRRVRSWSRVLAGCGGLDATLELTPEYLEVLDAIGAGPEEWAVVTALKTPKTPRALCRLVPGGDHRTCRLLWILRVLGAVRVAERPVADEPAPEASLTTACAERDETAAPAEEPVDVEVAETVAAAPVEEPAEEPVGATVDEPVDEPVDVAAAEPAEPAEPAESDSDETEPAGAEPAEEPAEAPVEAAHAAAESDEAEAESAEHTRAPAEQPVEAACAEPDEIEVPAVARDDFDDLPTSIPVALRTDEAEGDAAERASADDDEPWQPLSVRTTADGAPDDAAAEPRDAAEAEADPDSTQVLDREAVAAALGEAAAPADEAEPVSEPDPDATQALDRETVADAALAIDRQPPASDDMPHEAAADWTPPADLDRVIERFNAVQRLIYRAIRTEVGAGAANLIRSCCGQVDAGAAALAEAELRADGTWDADSLRRGVRACRLDDPWATYHELIEREIELLRVHVGDARAAELQRHVERLERQDAHA